MPISLSFVQIHLFSYPTYCKRQPLPCLSPYHLSRFTCSLIQHTVKDNHYRAYLPILCPSSHALLSYMQSLPVLLCLSPYPLSQFPCYLILHAKLTSITLPISLSFVPVPMLSYPTCGIKAGQKVGLYQSLDTTRADINYIN